MITRNNSGGGIKSVANAFEIIEYVRDAEQANLKQIADEVGLANSTAHEYLSTLRAAGYVVKRDNTYRLSLRFLSCGKHAQENYELLDAAREPLETLATESGELAWLVVEENGDAAYLEVVESEPAVNVSVRVGDHFPPGRHPAGKAILAHLPESRVEAVLDRGRSPTAAGDEAADPKALLDELANVREQGYAVGDGNHRGIRAVASPVLRDDAPVGSVGISGPGYRMGDDRLRNRLVDLVERAADGTEFWLLAERD